jgi:hypothetical protein
VERQSEVGAPIVDGPRPFLVPEHSDGVIADLGDQVAVGTEVIEASSQSFHPTTILPARGIIKLMGQHDHRRDLMLGVKPEKRTLPPVGRQPWDPANGLRVGTMVGGMVGAAFIAATGLFSFWLIAVPGVVGGCLGYWSEKRKQPDRPRKQ